MKSVVCFLVILFIGFSKQASAYLMYGNSRIDQALYHDDDQQLIVHATITKLNKREPLDSTQIRFFDGPEVRSVDVRINQVILGNAEFESAILNLNTASFMWPEDLVTLQADHELLLILRQDYSDSGAFYIQVVIPCVSGNFNYVSKKEDAQKLLAGELVTVVKASTETRHTRAVLRQLGPVLQADDATAVLPFVGHEDVWVKRAAIAALVYATEDTKALTLAAEDIQQFIQTTSKDSLIKNVDEDYHYAPYPFYKEYMFFIQSYCWKEGSGWSPEQTQKDCRIIEKIMALGILDKKTLNVLETEF